MRRVAGFFALVLLVGLGVAALTPGNPVAERVRDFDRLTAEPTATLEPPAATAPSTPPAAVTEEAVITEEPVAATQAGPTAVSAAESAAIGQPSLTYGARATLVKDGDSFEVEWLTGERPPGVTRDEVRLIGLNAPEFGDCFSVESRDRLRSMIGGEELRVELLETERNNGRQIANVWVDGVLVNLELVAGGFALAFGGDSPQARVIRDAQLLAQADGRGLWAPGVCVGSSDAIIAWIEDDPAGRDDFNLNEEWVEIENAGTVSIDLTGWSVRDESTFNRFVFPVGFSLAPGESVRIRSGAPDEDFDGLFWDAWDPVWNNSGDTAYLIDDEGRFADWRSYGHGS